MCERRTLATAVIALACRDEPDDVPTGPGPGCGRAGVLQPRPLGAPHRRHPLAHAAARRRRVEPAAVEPAVVAAAVVMGVHLRPSLEPKT